MKKVFNYRMHLIWGCIFFIPAHTIAQNTEIYKHYTKTYNAFAKALKSVNVHIIDSADTGLGVYEKLTDSYYDKDSLRNLLQKDTSFASEKIKYMFQQWYIHSLEAYVKKIPKKNLELIPNINSPRLDKNWRNDSNKEEIAEIENTMVLSFKNKNKRIELMYLTYNFTNKRLLYILLINLQKENLEYIENFIKKRHK